MTRGKTLYTALKLMNPFALQSTDGIRKTVCTHIDSPRYPGGAKPPARGAEAHIAPTTHASNRLEVTIALTTGVRHRGPLISFVQVLVTNACYCAWLLDFCRRVLM